MGLKVGCAWSPKRDRGRRQTHESQSHSSSQALRNSRFHQFRQDAANIIAAEPSFKVHYWWDTLAEGHQIIRRHAQDDDLPALWYEIESMFSSALGAIADDCNDHAYLALKGWPWQVESMGEHRKVIAEQQKSQVQFP
ncbi:RAD50-interacting protein 1 [Elsinoe australis]|uniref:RAD50-interacting protein 1 n=1 Tax=Elsinoe australis TaxID=40998 RepID=A0A2P8A5D9_9PEZI|nr:RAD50-interacting protein 1 [Elsinoe australis]